VKPFAKALNRHLIDPSEQGQPTEFIPSEPCTLFQVVLEDYQEDNWDHHNEHIPWRCQFYGAVTESGIQDRMTNFVNVEGIDRNLAEKHDIVSGITTLLVDRAMLENGNIVLHSNYRLIFGENKNPRARKSQDIHDFSRTTGVKTVLAVRVKTLDAEPTATIDQIGDDVFGGNGDIVNLKS